MTHDKPTILVLSHSSRSTGAMVNMLRAMGEVGSILLVETQSRADITGIEHNLAAIDELIGNEAIKEAVKVYGEKPTVKLDPFAAVPIGQRRRPYKGGE